MTQELAAQLELIERMILEGRRATEYWGWAFLLWGLGHAGAYLWALSWHGNPGIPWAVVMSGCGVVSGIGAARIARRAEKETAVNRSLRAIWWGMGISAMLVGLLGGWSGALDGRGILIAFFLLMGSANFASGLVLRWRLQLVVAVLWWGAACAYMFAPTAWLFLAMVGVGEVGFGIYLMILERRDRG